MIDIDWVSAWTTGGGAWLYVHEVALPSSWLERRGVHACGGRITSKLPYFGGPFGVPEFVTD